MKAQDVIAKAIYETDPFYEDGEYVEGFQVSSGGHLTWKQALERDAEFVGDKILLPITKFAFDAADHILAEIATAPESIRLELAGLLNPWLPIETAPENGDFIVGGPTKVTIGWRGGEDEFGNICQWDGDEKPTHWLPFPAPPSEDKI